MSQQFVSSSPSAMENDGSIRRRKSRFTYKQLTQLSLSSTTCPLRTIAHIDLDAFYAQCETVRLGLPEDRPLAVQQWQGLIAINYPARKYGLSRHIDITEAKKLCPELYFQHVATWREGDDKWAYHDNAAENIGTHKVSLDPYRKESRRILAVIKDVLPPAPVQRVEKASIDEVFLDLSAQVHGILVERYPELSLPPPYDDPTENLPPPPTTALDWDTDALVDLDEAESEERDPDWDDMVMLIGSEIVRSVRAAVRDRLKYTCSAGIARNKMLAKLASGYKKPNQQTVVRTRAVQKFLNDLKFTKIRNLGGKLGDHVVSAFGTEMVKDLLPVSKEQLKAKIGDDTGSWVYELLRGEDYSEVNSRTQIKSMLSAKSFRPSINSTDQALKWLRIFVADIFSRLVEEGVLEHKRRPKTINLHHRHGGQTKSRQAPIPSGKTVDETILFELAKNLLNQVLSEGNSWPCAGLQLSVGGFEELVSGNIGAFVVRGDEAKAMYASMREPNNSRPHALSEEKPAAKRRRVDSGGIQKFFQRKDESKGEQSEDSFEEENLSQAAISSPAHQSPRQGPGRLHTSAMGGSDVPAEHDGISLYENPRAPTEEPTFSAVSKGVDSDIDAKTPSGKECSRCRKQLLLSEMEQHEDWHLATELQAQEDGSASLTGHERSSSRPASRVQQRDHPHRGSSIKSSSGDRGARGRGKVEKGQQRLAFGPSS